MSGGGSTSRDKGVEAVAGAGVSGPGWVAVRISDGVPGGEKGGGGKV